MQTMPICVSYISGKKKHGIFVEVLCFVLCLSLKKPSKTSTTDSRTSFLASWIRFFCLFGIPTTKFLRIFTKFSNVISSLLFCNIQTTVTDEVSSLVFLLAVFFACSKRISFQQPQFFVAEVLMEQTNLWLPRVQGTGHVANPPHCLQKVPRHRIRCERLSCDLG